MNLTFIVIFLLAAASVLFLVLFVKKSSESKAAAQESADSKTKCLEAEKRIQEISATLSTLQAERDRLSKWQAVEDADAKARELLASAQNEAARLQRETREQSDALRKNASLLLEGAKSEAVRLVQQARDEAAQLRSDARDQSEQLRQNGAAFLDGARVEAERIVRDANKQAEEIAGTAYAAAKNAEQLEKTIKALKNTLDGYGNEYLIPRQSLLDDLAAEFGYAEAGLELKHARERTRLMIRNGTAATCDYVETRRKDTAVEFVIDAFNGKVDSILSRVKNDNVGKLKQEIEDAFILVNANGAAFRDARIHPAYRDARLQELKWAAVAQQLKMDERDEQRRIKERIREEEKAKREYERAIKEAQKEEAMLVKAIEKAQELIAKSSEEQKVKYELQLQELTEKLQAAEAKNQRALSMAQQTKSGHVYIISNVGSFGDHVYKIGLTRRLEPLDRIRELGDSSVPFGFDVHAMIFSENAPALENQLHKHFVLMQINKVNFRKEFFRVDLAHIRDEIEKLGLSAKWTMAAAAQEYRESLAIEKAINENPAQMDAWVKRQLLLEPAYDTAEDEEPAAG